MARKWSGLFSNIFILLAFCYIQPSDSIELAFGDFTDILRYGKDTMFDLLESWELIRDRLPGAEDTQFPFVKRMEKILKNRISEVSHKLDMYQLRTEAKTQEVLEQLMTHLPQKIAMTENFRNFDFYVGQINDLYDNFVKYATTLESYERYTLENFAKASVSPDLGALPDVLKTLHRLVVPTQSQLFNNSILVVFANELKVRLQEISHVFSCDEYANG
ncbi:hypothetical protein KPH14_007698 [Odynerus spinipes]|uniref:Uncharacterized protein n=1 Tax=Odynerus spinipes TaxID=1348599 RepID=A0AAD9RIV2_9HYME|nr:hypothetical protein KPH14_007698 [Odynerus spinipes]